MSDKQNILEIVQQVAMKKSGLVSVLASFVATDTVLYLRQLSDENIKKKAERAVVQVNDIMHTRYVTVCSLDVIGKNQAQREKTEIYLQGLKDKIFAILYLMATELRSVIIGVLFVNKKITIQDAFQLAFAEELEQQRYWGADSFTKQRQKDIMDKLMKLEEIVLCEKFI